MTKKVILSIFSLFNIIFMFIILYINDYTVYVIGVPMVIVISIFLRIIQFKIHKFICPKCNNTFEVSFFLRGLISKNFLFIKQRLFCPKCCKVSWCNVIPKD
jgi:hypothetical protein